MQESQDIVEVSFIVENHHSGMRLDRFLMARLPGYSRNEIQGIIETRLVQSDRSLKKSSIVKPGNNVLILYRKKEETAREVNIPVIFEDEHIILVNKPPDIPVHSTNPWGKNDLIQQIRRKRDTSEIFLAHRLDRETSGLLMLARSREAARRLGAVFNGRSIKKEYLAIVFGLVPNSHGTIKTFFGRDMKSPVKIKMSASVDSGMSALTEYEVVVRAGRFSLVRAIPHTGRQHQIRVHLSSIGFPLVGDKIYNDDRLFLEFIRDGFTERLKQRLVLPRHALHASGMEFQHPFSGKPLRFSSEMPEDMLKLIELCDSACQYVRPEGEASLEIGDEIM